jgi:hypothetical protein
MDYFTVLLTAVRALNLSRTGIRTKKNCTAKVPWSNKKIRPGWFFYLWYDIEAPRRKQWRIFDRKEFRLF